MTTCAIPDKSQFRRSLHQVGTLLVTSRVWILAVSHTLLFAAILWFSFWVRFDFAWPLDRHDDYRAALGWFLAIKLVVFAATGQFHGWWRFVTFADLVALARGCVLCFVALAVANFFLFGTTAGIPRSIILLDSVFTLVLLSSLRSTWRLFRECLWPAMNAGNYCSALLVGTDEQSVCLANQIQSYGHSPYRVQGLVSVNGARNSGRAGRMPILGNLNDLSRIAAAHAAKVVLVTAGRLPGRSLRELMQICADEGLDLKIVPPLEDRLRGDKRLPIRDINIEDLLRREPVELDAEAIGRLLAGRRVLVTGAGGSIGSEICRQVLRFGPESLILLGRGENRIFAIERELRESHLSGHSPPAHEANTHKNLKSESANLKSEICNLKSKVRAVIADIRDAPRLRQVFAEYRPEVVFHAAAHKHVPLMEANVAEAVKNNILGTRAVADLAEQFGASHFVLISTDKAVRPTSVMGATKQIAESYVQALASAACSMSHAKSAEDADQKSGARSPHTNGQAHTHPLTYSRAHPPQSESRNLKSEITKFLVVRFGNVLGSAGSVVPIFQEQIRRGGPLTLTDPRMQRYFMTIPEASQLVLQAAAMGAGGEVFVLEMGEPVKISDLARDLIQLSGLPADSIEIVHAGIRPGEKLFEELTLDPDRALKTEHPKVWSVYQPPRDIAEITSRIDELEAACTAPNDELRERLISLTDASTTRQPPVSTATREEVHRAAESRPGPQVAHCENRLDVVPPETSPAAAQPGNAHYAETPI